MNDWVFVLAPILLLPIVWLFVFVGCELTHATRTRAEPPLVPAPPRGIVVNVIPVFPFSMRTRIVRVVYSHASLGGSYVKNLIIDWEINPRGLRSGRASDRGYVILRPGESRFPPPGERPGVLYDAFEPAADIRFFELRIERPSTGAWEVYCMASVMLPGADLMQYHASLSAPVLFDAGSLEPAEPPQTFTLTFEDDPGAPGRRRLVLTPG